MPFAAAAAGAAVSAGTGLIGGILQSGAVSAGKSQANAALQAGLQQANTALSPYNTAGQGALGVVSNLSGANGPDAATAAMANFHTDPGYQFQLQQGLRAVDAGAASKGLLNSGATIKGEETFGSGLADQSFTNYYNRLFDLSKLGESAGHDIASASTGTASNIANVDTGAAGAQASIIGNTAKGLGTTLGGLFTNPMNPLFPSSSESGNLPGLPGNAGNFDVPPEG